jgi:plastocyanin
LKRGRCWTAAFCLVLSLAACRPGEKKNDNPPDKLLQDSLGLTADSHVHRVALRTDSGAETVAPAQVVIEPGALVEFYTRDRRVRTVSFQLDGLTPEQASFLRASGQDRSPPLVELDSRFVVSFKDAPAGVYRYTVEGTGSPAFGSVQVQAASK